MQQNKKKDAMQQSNNAAHARLKGREYAMQQSNNAAHA